MAVRVEEVTVTGCTASGMGFDLVLDAGKTRHVGLTRVLCDEVAPGVERRTLPIELVLNWDCIGGLLDCVESHCPGAQSWFEGFLDKIRELLPPDFHPTTPPRKSALRAIRPNPDVDCRCGEELCYWDAELGIIVCVE